jgi:hypothetical protein
MRSSILTRVMTPALVMLMCSTSANGRTTVVPPDGDLQTAIMNAQSGDTIVLTAGAVYTGNFTLTDRGGDDFITIRTADNPGLPVEGARISPDHAPLLAKIRTNSNQPAIQTAPNAHHWRLMLLEIESTSNAAGEIVALGSGTSVQVSKATVPHDLVLDRLYIHADARTGRTRGIALNSASTSITGSYISEIKAVGQDSQAIAGWNGPGPYVIANNYLEAAGENILFGGADPRIPDLVPSDIAITGNTLSKQVSWRNQPWSVKNILELKNARRVSITGNTLEYNWQGGQSGYAVLFTVRNQDGGCPWCQVDHVQFRRNVVRDVAAGIQILGVDNNHPSRQTQAIEIRDNVFARIDNERWGGNGYFMTLAGGARDITVDHNTVVTEHGAGFVQVDGAPVLGFVLTNNVAKHNAFGIIGSGRGVGMDTIGAFFPGSYIASNVLAGGAPERYPRGNFFPTVRQFEEQFRSYTTADFRLVASSPWRGAGTDGRDLGASLIAPDRRDPRVR